MVCWRQEGSGKGLSGETEEARSRQSFSWGPRKCGQVLSKGVVWTSLL